jgi:hypothetical protein
MQAIFLQNLFIYYYWKFKELVIFHEIVRNISASGFRCKMRYNELILKILLTFGLFSNNIWISSEEKVLAGPLFTVCVFNSLVYKFFVKYICSDKMIPSRRYRKTCFINHYSCAKCGLLLLVWEILIFCRSPRSKYTNNLMTSLCCAVSHGIRQVNMRVFFPAHIKMLIFYFFNFRWPFFPCPIHPET